MTLRDGNGGGKRVSAATACGPWSTTDIHIAEQGMRDLSQPLLFMLLPHETGLDDALARLGYDIVDPVLAYACNINTLAIRPLNPLSTFDHWPPLAIAKDLWHHANIGPQRLAIMDRVAQQKTVILGRTQTDRVCGVGFVAVHQDIAMLHALAVSPPYRRQGFAQNMICAAARWAQALGADRLALVVTKANTPACRLYEAMGMQIVGGYHYRQKHEGDRS
jgi:ribosomal protein S18 acetylase RimI-like enzyme